MTHLSRDLAPFWLRPEALGSPVGAFPTFRCDDGTLVDPELPCGEMLDRRPVGLLAAREGVHADEVAPDVLLRRRLPPHGRGEVPRPREGRRRPPPRARPRPVRAERRLVVEGRRRAAARRREDLAGPRLREPRPRLLRLPDARPGGPRRRAPPLRRDLRAVRRPVPRDSSAGPRAASAARRHASSSSRSSTR